MIGPTMMPAPHIAIACPCFSRGLMSSRNVWLSGTIAAPKSPCRMRKPTIEPRFQLSPHAIEESTKPTTEVRNTLRRPNLSETQPVIGVMIAAATM